MNILEFFLPRSVKKNVIVKKYKKMSYEQSIIAAARELQTLDPAQPIVKSAYLNFMPATPSNKLMQFQHKGLTS